MSGVEFSIGKYKLLNCIASGQTTQIWEGMPEGSVEKCAVKMILPEAFKVKENRLILKHEAAVMKTLDHPNIVKFRELVLTKEYGFFAMELFRTNNVKTQIQIDLVSIQSRVKRLVELTSLALSAVHQKGWIHRDIKPDNILFNRGSELRLVDFSLTQKVIKGFAKMMYRRKTLVQGTRTYMSPEQIKGQILGPQSDIYSFGISIYEMLTGKTPFQGMNPKELLRRHIETPPIPPGELNPNITPEMDKFVLRLLAKKVKDRPKDMNDFMAEFRGITVWKEPPESLVKTEKGEQKENFSLGERRDSRSDALRQELIKQGKLPGGGSGPKPPAPPPGQKAPPSPPRPPGSSVPPPAPVPPRPSAGSPPEPAGSPRPPVAPPPPAAPRPPMPGVAPPSPPPGGGPPRPPAGGPPPAIPRPPAPPAPRSNAPPAPPPRPPAPRPPAPPKGGSDLDGFNIS